MTTIPAPYAVSTDPAARRWWAGLSESCRRALKRSWDEDERDDPLTPVARRLAGFLNACALDPESAEPVRPHVVSRRGYVEAWGHDPRIRFHICSGAGGGIKLLDEGMVWPLHIEAGRWRIDRERLSAEQRDLLSRHEASG